MELITKAVLMVGGEGRRLRPHTETAPKAMLDVGGVPILEITLERLITAGIRDFYFCVNYLRRKIEDHFGDGARFGVRIRYVKEPFQMGTVGALKLITDIDKRFLLMNGDLYTDLDFRDFFVKFRQSDADFYICSREDVLQSKHGVLRLANHNVVGITEKPTVTHMINCGIYACKSVVMDYIPKDHYFDATFLIQALVNSDKDVMVYEMDRETNWIDIGTSADYKRLSKFMEDEKEWENRQL